MTLDAPVPALQGGSRFVPARREVALTGAVFLDALHGQTRAAPNGADLHPIIALRVLWRLKSRAERMPIRVA